MANTRKVNRKRKYLAADKSPDKRLCSVREIKQQFFREFHYRVVLNEKRYTCTPTNNINFFANTYFTKMPHDAKMWLIWPRHQDERKILISLIEAKDVRNCDLFFIDEKDAASDAIQNAFLKIQIESKSFNAAYSRPSDQWNENDIADLVSYFRWIFNMPSEKKQAADKELSLDRFNQVIQENSKRNFPARLKCTLDISRKLSEKFVFQLNYGDKDHPRRILSVELFPAAYQSYVMSEWALQKLHGRHDQRYYLLIAYEWLPEDGQKKGEKVLEIQLTLDAVIGELYKIMKGRTLSGTQILQFYVEKLDQLLQIGTTYVCDASLVDGNPLRLIRKLATNQNWYEKVGFKMLDCEDLHAGTAESPRKVTQNSDVYQATTNQLRQMKVSEFIKLRNEEKIKLHEQQTVVLNMLCNDFPKHVELRQFKAEFQAKNKINHSEAYAKLSHQSVALAELSDLAISKKDMTDVGTLFKEDYEQYDFSKKLLDIVGTYAYLKAVAEMRAQLQLDSKPDDKAEKKVTYENADEVRSAVARMLNWQFFVKERRPRLAIDQPLPTYSTSNKYTV